MNSETPRQLLPREIALISRRWRARLDERLRHTGLTQSRWHALLELAKSPEPLTQRELAERVGVEGPTLVRQLDDLQRQGLIERCPVQGDRRANNVRLTPQAQPLIAELTAIADELRAELLQDVSDEELAHVLAVLRRVSARLDQ
jgi:MarR family transcriptional regulator for hemolysin